MLSDVLKIIFELMNSAQNCSHFKGNINMKLDLFQNALGNWARRHSNLAIHPAGERDGIPQRPQPCEAQPW
jgi:hypothetical protein